MMKHRVAYFKPPFEERNPELLILEHKNLHLKEILAEKHTPFHKFISNRPQSACD